MEFLLSLSFPVKRHDPSLHGLSSKFPIPITFENEILKLTVCQ